MHLACTIILPFFNDKWSDWIGWIGKGSMLHFAAVPVDMDPLTQISI